MALHPVVTIIAAIVGARLGGAIGAFLALPAAAIIQATVSQYIRRHEVVEDELTDVEEHPPEK
jgi:predicted PurR-regulated permease PerM